MQRTRKLIGFGLLIVVLLTASGCPLVLLPAAIGVGVGAGLEADALFGGRDAQTKADPAPRPVDVDARPNPK